MSISRRLFSGVAVLVCAGIVFPAPVVAQPLIPCTSALPLLPPLPSAGPMTFGVIDEELTPRSAALAHRMRGDLPNFTVHSYVSAANTPEMLSNTLGALRALANKGFRISLNINDEPKGGDRVPHDAFVEFVRRIIADNGSWLSAVEITNEPNLPGTPNTDGSSPDVVRDVVDGVIVAKQTAVGHGYGLQVAFDWDYDFGIFPGFWDQLRAISTPEFIRSVDFFGLHTYPNPASAATPIGDYLEAGELQGMASARCWMAYIGLPITLPIDITEVGYPTPTGPAGYEAQAEFWQRILAAVSLFRGAYGVRSLYFYELTDVPNLIPGLSGFGLFTDQGDPKPALDVAETVMNATGR
ncbi:hypothetical protein [Nocardia arthritidis]|uniref:Uncharacterized protein n=1 Tax=Nocardia arthritidis TaxID=228602 RepID=A0A6G9YMW9_9NOCA|nr:hypothetical protein [Nocardia arthritidis]QIS14548.1 hypothetical protein F5544_33560 [Nocardia arthritidis]